MVVEEGPEDRVREAVAAVVVLVSCSANGRQKCALVPVRNIVTQPDGLAGVLLGKSLLYDGLVRAGDVETAPPDPGERHLPFAPGQGGDEPSRAHLERVLGGIAPGRCRSRGRGDVQVGLVRMSRDGDWQPVGDDDQARRGPIELGHGGRRRGMKLAPPTGPALLVGPRRGSTLHGGHGQSASVPGHVPWDSGRPGQDQELSSSLATFGPGRRRGPGGSGMGRLPRGRYGLDGRRHAQPTAPAASVRPASVCAAKSTPCVVSGALSVTPAGGFGCFPISYRGHPPLDPPCAISSFLPHIRSVPLLSGYEASTTWRRTSNPARTARRTRVMFKTHRPGQWPNRPSCPAFTTAVRHLSAPEVARPSTRRAVSPSRKDPRRTRPAKTKGRGGRSRSSLTATRLRFTSVRHARSKDTISSPIFLPSRSCTLAPRLV